MMKVDEINPATTHVIINIYACSLSANCDKNVFEF